MKIPFLNLRKQYQVVKRSVDKVINDVCRSQNFILGSELTTFENKFAKYLGSKHFVGVASGTDALVLALLALGIGEGDEVITQSNTFIATALAITQVGAKPIFVDINPNTFQIDENKIQSKITKKTKAVLPVHLYGAPCQIDEIRNICKDNNLFLIEDACQAHGSMFEKQPVGTFGDIGVFSFYPSKNLGAYGDGGGLSTNNKDIYEKLIKLRNYGQTKKYYHDEIGRNSRLDEIQAAILTAKLPYLNGWNSARRHIANLYHKNLKGIKTQKMIENTQSNYYLYVIEVENRVHLIKSLKKKGIDTLIHYPVPIHLQDCYKYLGYKRGDLPITEYNTDRIISLPIYPELSDNEVYYVTETINNCHTLFL